MIDNEQRKGISLIGSGAVATSLGYALRDAGFTIDSIVSASLPTATDLRVRLGASVASSDFADLRPDSDIVFVCVPDAVIDDVAERLAELDINWEAKLVAHTSGAVHANALQPLETKGADILSFHPLQSFPSNGGTAAVVKSFHDVYIGLEGEDHAVSRGRAIAESIGARGIRIATSKKEAYHLAASVASNLFVAVVAIAGEILEASGLNNEAGPDMFLPLIEGTLDNLKQASPERALTGPIARGDVLTVRKHLDALKTFAPHLLPIYGSLSTEAVRAAVRGGHISSVVAEDILDTLLYGIEVH